MAERKAAQVQVKFGKKLGLKDAARLICAVGRSDNDEGFVTTMLRGEPGIGKTSILELLVENLGTGYNYPAPVDCPNLDFSDWMVPKVEMESVMIDGRTQRVPIIHHGIAERLMIHQGKPIVLLLDEFGKAPQINQAMLTPVLLEQRIGERYLPKGSIVFCTSNLTTDGVGDNIKAHARNRICEITIEKPKAFEYNERGELEVGEWGHWAMNHNIAPEILAWAKQYPHAFAAYDDPDQGDNPYIFHPNKAGQVAFVTNRSLAKASVILKKRERLGQDTTIAGLIGTVGEACARDLVAFTQISDKLPSWDVIVGSPNKAPVPDDAAAMCILVFSAVMNVQKETFGPWMDYFTRLKKETQALFAISIIKSNTKSSIAVTNAKFRNFALANQYMFE
jgi:hypothetical protein